MSRQILLQKGDTIGLICPSSPMRAGRLELGLDYLEGKGFKVKQGKHIQDNKRFMAGEDEARAADIMHFFRDDAVKLIMATGGGYGSQRILPLLDYDCIRKNPKGLIGFSDTTALQLGLLTRANMPSFTGFGFRDLEEKGPDPLIERTMFACFNNEPYKVQEGNTAIPGKAEGILIGGTLSLITALMGTPFQPDFREAILLIEEVFAEPFQVDSMLSQLELAGVFQAVNGVIFGQFVFCEAKDHPERDGSIDDVVDEWTQRIQRPCLKDFPYGHGSRRAVLPIGKRVLLDADKGLVEVYA